MGLELFANLAQTAISAGGTSAPAQGTVETWTVASPGLFPVITQTASWFHVADVNPLNNSEIIRVTAVSGSVWTVTRGAGGTTPVAHASGFTVALTVTAAALRSFQYQAWQFLPEAYGAKGDGKLANDVTTSNTSAVITSPTIAADTLAVGKFIMVNGGLGASAAPLIGTIQSVNGNNVTLSVTAGATIASGGQAFWASDDTTAINTTVTAAGNYATANNYYAEVVFQAKFYGLASGPTQSVSPQFNAQIPLPYPNVNGATQKLIIKFTGAAPNDAFQFWESTIPNLEGTALVSMVKAPTTVDPTYGNQSVIGGPSGGGAFTGTFANTKAVIDGISVWCPPITDQYAYDFRYLAAAGVYKSSAQAFCSVLGNSPTIPSLPGNGTFQGRHCIALAMPVTGNNADNDIDTFVAEGFTTSFLAADTFNARRAGAFYTSVGLKMDLTLGLSNKLATIAIVDYICGQSNTCISCGGSGGLVPVYITMTTEGIATAHLSDTGNQLVGVIHWNDTGATAPTISGGAQVKFINDRATLGYVSSGAPSVPSSTTATTAIYRDSMVAIATGAGVTVSAVTIDGQATGLTMGASSALSVVVPAGKTIALTYAGGTPTWLWYGF